jgi:hypothetical protein
LFPLKKSKWRLPVENRKIGVYELFFLLRKEAERIEKALGYAVPISTQILDLRPRLKIER